MLITIDLALVYIISLIRGKTEGIKPLLYKIPAYGAYIFLVQQYQVILNSICASFIKAGITAGGGGVSTADFTNPSLIITKGFDLIGPVLDNYIAHNDSFKWLLVEALGELVSPAITQVAGMLGVAPKMSVVMSLLLIVISSLLIMACFFVIGMQLFVIQVEFALVAALGIILIPFGVWDKTSFIFDKIKTGIVNFGIKLMLMATLTATCITLLKNLTLPAEPTWQNMLYLLLGSAAMAYLAVIMPKEVDQLSR